MATDFHDLAKTRLESGFGVPSSELPQAVVDNIDATANIIKANTTGLTEPEAFKVLKDAMKTYDQGDVRIRHQELVDVSVSDKAMTTFDANPAQKLSEAEVSIPTPGGRLKLREKLTNRHVSNFLTGTNDLATFRTGTLDTEMSSQRIDGNIYTQVEESIKREIDNRVASLEGKTPVEILAAFNTTGNPELKSRIGATYAEQISQARVLNENSSFLQTTQNMAQYEAGLQAAIAANTMTVEQANLARQHLHSEMSRSAREVVDQVTKGTMSLADARAYAATINNPELGSRIDAAVNALDTTNMEPGGTDAATAVADLLASPDLQNLGTGLQAVLTEEANASLERATNLRQIATDQDNLATMARNIEGDFANVERNARIGYLLRKVGPVALIAALSLLGVTFLPAGLLATFPINTLILSAGGVGALYQYFGQGGIRPYLSQRLKESSANLDIASKYTESGTRHRADAATQDREVVQNMMKANANFRSRRLPAEAQPAVVQYLSNQLGGNIAPK
jgi:hypothetical protein